jgi:hypothetical protein
MDRPAETTAPTYDQVALFLADLQLASERGTPQAEAALRHPQVMHHYLAMATQQAAPVPAPQQAAPLPVPARPAAPVGQYLAAGAGAAAVLIPLLLTITAALVAAGTAALALAVTALVIRWIMNDIRRG